MAEKKGFFSWSEREKMKELAKIASSLE